jgi:histidinol-phosphate aminotransferase
MNTVNRFAQLAPAHIQKLVAYDPGYEPSEIKARLGLPDIVELGSNENSFGPAPAVKALLAAPTLSGFRYPDASGGVLKQALSKRYQLPVDRFTLGNGTHELLTLIAETFCSPADEVVHAQYGFAVYRLAALGAGATPVAVPADSQLNVSPAAMLAAVNAHTKLVYLANPNNPTGTLWDTAQVRDLLLGLPAQVILVLDEAYIEYVEHFDPDSALALLNQFPNLVIARTFSKAYALASLRVGYTIAHPDFAQMLERTRLSFNVNVLALKAAALAIADTAHLQSVRRETSKARAHLISGLHALGLHVLPSPCNFVLVDFKRDAAPIERALVEKGVIVRPVRAYGLPEHLRITVGRPEEGQAVLKALAAVLNRH